MKVKVGVVGPLKGVFQKRAAAVRNVKDIDHFTAGAVLEDESKLAALIVKSLLDLQHPLLFVEGECHASRTVQSEEGHLAVPGLTRGRMEEVGHLAPKVGSPSSQRGWQHDAEGDFSVMPYVLVANRAELGCSVLDMNKPVAAIELDAYSLPGLVEHRRRVLVQSLETPVFNLLGRIDSPVTVETSSRHHR